MRFPARVPSRESSPVGLRLRARLPFRVSEGRVCACFHLAQAKAAAQLPPEGWVAPEAEFCVVSLWLPQSGSSSGLGIHAASHLEV